MSPRRADDVRRNMGLNINDPALPRLAAEWLWDDVLKRVERKDQPTKRELGDLVKRHGVPSFAQEYVGALLCDEVHLGDGGRPSMAPSERRRRDAFVWHMVCLVEWRREVCGRVRLAAPRAKSVRARLFPEKGFVTVLRTTSTATSDWVRTKDGKWKLRSPLSYAILRVALDWGVEPKRLRRLRKDFIPELTRREWWREAQSECPA